MFDDFIKLVREIYKTKEFIPLHAPVFVGNEKKYVNDAINSSYVSSVSDYVIKFEELVKKFTKSKYAIATINGTSALHMALLGVGVKENTEVITQSFTFVATCNAIRYCNAEPVFIDINNKTLSLSAYSLECFLEEYVEIRNDGYSYNITTNKRIVACLIMHTFGLPSKIEKILKLCKKYNIDLVEDCAESLGSFYNSSHTGTLSSTAAISFNGNKIITTGGGGMVLTNNKNIAQSIRHLSTTAKLNHKWEFDHDKIGYNYRMPGINAALGVAQMENLDNFINIKRNIAKTYQEWSFGFDFYCSSEETNCFSNYWLNTFVMNDKKQRDEMLQVVNSKDVMIRPAWKPMHMLEMNKNYQKLPLENTEFFYERIINVPSGVPKVLLNNE